MNPDLVRVAAVWIAWCALHSLLIAAPVRRALRQRLGRAGRAYRLLYNVLALATFVPALLYTRAVGGPVVFDWGGARPVSVALLALAVLLFWAGSRGHDGNAFLGLRELREGPRERDAHPTGVISRRGILGAIRHPWYTGGMLLVWAGPKTGALMVAAVIMSVYFVVGATIEERRLVAEFGDVYRRYQREVSMFLPLRWLRARLASG